MKKKLFATFLFLLIPLFLFGCSNGNENQFIPESDVFKYYNNLNDSVKELKTSSDKIYFDENFGYEFGGVYSSPNGIGTKYFDETGSLIPGMVIVSDMSLYGYYSPKMYDITLYVDDIIFETVSGVLYGDTILSFNCPTKEGKSFNGWYCGNSRVTNEYGQVLEGFEKLGKGYFINGSPILTANWDDVIVSIDYVDNIVGDDIPSDSVVYGDNIKELKYRDKEYNGYEFLGWSYTNDFYNPKYYNNEIIKETTVLYAIYIQYKDIDFSNGNEILFTKRMYNDGTSIKISDLGTKEIPGYNILGCYSKPTFSGSSIVNSISFYSNDILYINYSPIEYTVSFDCPNDVDNNTQTLYYNIENEIELPVATKKNYDFIGWCKNNDLSDDPITKIAKGNLGNIILYPKFSPAKRTITYSLDEGSISSNSTIVTYSMSYKLMVPTHETKGFVGWYIIDDNEKTFITDKNGNSLNNYLFDEDIIVYAEFKTKYYINVEIDTSLGSVDINQYYIAGEAVSFKINVKDGYYISSITFDNEEKEVTSNYSFDMPEADVNVSVIIKPCMYKITFDADGGKSNIDSDYVRFNSEYILPTASKLGYEFKGWVISGDVKLYNGTIKWLFTFDIVLVAKYEEIANVKIIYNQEDLISIKNDTTAINYFLANDIKIDNDYSPVELLNYSVFDGCGNKITGLTTALFTNLRGTVKNLELEANIKVDNAPNYGILACAAYDDSKMFNIITRGKLEVNSCEYVGALFGQASGSTQFEIYDNINYADLTVTTGRNQVGGFVGGLNLYKKFTNNINYGNISSNDKTGGLIGLIHGSTLTVKNCSNYGVIKGNAGGLVGIVSGGSVNFDNCVSVGSANKKYLGSGSYQVLSYPTIDINNLDEFYWLKSNVAGEVYNLLVDIDLTDSDWTSCNFFGELNGNNHNITGLTTSLFDDISGEVFDLKIDANITNIKGDAFGCLAATISSTASIHGIEATGSINVSDAKSNIGGIVGRVAIKANAKMYDCINRINITSTNNGAYGIGGVIAGQVENNCALLFENNINYGTIKNSDVTGGVIGFIGGSNIIKKCKNYGDVISNNAGGILGKSFNSNVTIDGCVSNILVKNGNRYVGVGNVKYLNLSTVWINDIEDFMLLNGCAPNQIFNLNEDIDLTEVVWTPCDFSGVLNGNNHKITGLTTSLFNDISGEVFDLGLDVCIINASSNALGSLACTLSSTASVYYIKTTGSITVSGEINVGGIIGRVSSNANCKIYNCENNVNIISNNNKDYAVGGILGTLHQTSLVFEDNINKGIIQATTYAGGILGGATDNLTIKNCENYGNVIATNASGILCTTNSSKNVTIDGCISSVLIKGGHRFVKMGSVTYLNLNDIEVAGLEDLEMINGCAPDQMFNLNADIDLTDSDWTPCDFSGVLNGNNHKIIGLTTSLFTTLTGTINNLTLEVEINTTSSVGALASTAKGNAKLEYINVNGTIKTTGNCDVGGIVGLVSDSSVKISHCVNYANITSTETKWACGGIVGSYTNGGDISNCVNRGKITSSNNNGGIIGHSGKAINIKRCENYGDVLETGNIGGIIGCCASGTVTIDHCIVKCNTTGNKYVGSGSVIYDLDVYKIKTANDLDDLKLNIKEEEFILCNDIDLTEVVWTPCDFKGTLDGGGYKISNLSLTNKEESIGLFKTITGSISNLKIEGFEFSSTASLTTNVNAGILCSILSGTIENVRITSSKLTIKSGNAGAFAGKMTAGKIVNSTSGNADNDVIITSSNEESNLGGFIGYYTGGTLETVENKSTINSKGSAGGIIGKYEHNGTYTLKLLTNNGDITGNDYVGGICGYFLDSKAHNDFITNFINNGTINGNDYIGGIFGYAKFTGFYEVENSGNVSGKNYIGGLIGYGIGVKNGTVIEESTVSRTITSSSAYIGGIAGRLDSVTVKNCYNENANITATKYLINDNNYYVYLGGFVGYGGDFVECENKANITYENKGNYVGGIAGYTTGTITNCSNVKDITASKSSYVGGIVGYNGVSGTLTYENNINTGTVKGNEYVGGLFGYIQNYVGLYQGSNPTYTMILSNHTNTGEITGVNYVGGIVGYIKVYGTNTYYSSSRCYLEIDIVEANNTSNITGETYVGGLVGYGYSNSSSSVITESSVTGTITGKYYIGTLAGKLETIGIKSSINTNSKLIVSGYLNENQVHYAYVGGFVGYGYFVSDCTNDVEIKYTEDGIYVGGIAGYTTGTITNCSNVKDITASKSSYVGGIVGYNGVSGTLTYENNINTGTVKGNEYVGGLFGYIQNYVGLYQGSNPTYTMILSNHTNTGEITGVNYVGGIVGYIKVYGTNTYYSSSRCYLEIDIVEANNTSNITGETYVGGLVGYGYSNSSSSVITESSVTGTITGNENTNTIIGYSENITVKESD